MYVHTTPSQSTSTAVVKKKDLGTYFIYIYVWYKDLQKVVILVTWFTFGFCLRPEKIYWMGKTQKVFAAAAATIL